MNPFGLGRGEGTRWLQAAICIALGPCIALLPFCADFHSDLQRSPGRCGVLDGDDFIWAMRC
jgi:hypothetical protein